MTTMTLQPGITSSRPGPGTETLDELAWAIDGDGIGRHEAAVDRVVTWARALGFDPVLLDVLSDPAQPPVARERAFGALTRTVARRDGTADRPSDPHRIAA
jgi:hypothetical protein